MQRKSTLEKKTKKEKYRSGNAVMDKKISNSIKTVHKLSKKGGTTSLKEPIKTYDEEMYQDMFTFVTTPISAEYLKKCAREWIDVTRDNEDILFIHEYRVHKEIPEKTWERWIDRSPELQNARTLVRDIIAMRREKGAIQNKYNGAVITKVQCVYSKEWKETEEWRASLSAKHEESKVAPIQVILERYPDSPLVPMKKQVDPE